MLYSDNWFQYTKKAQIQTIIKKGDMIKIPTEEEYLNQEYLLMNCQKSKRL